MTSFAWGANLILGDDFNLLIEEELEQPVSEGDVLSKEEIAMRQRNFDSLREQQGAAKIEYILQLRRYDSTGRGYGAVVSQREVLHYIERQLPGNNGEVSSITV